MGNSRLTRLNAGLNINLRESRIWRLFVTSTIMIVVGRVRERIFGGRNSLERWSKLKKSGFLRYFTIDRKIPPRKISIVKSILRLIWALIYD